MNVDYSVFLVSLAAGLAGVSLMVKEVLRWWSGEGLNEDAAPPPPEREPEAAAETMSDGDGDANAACSYCGWRGGMMGLAEARRVGAAHALTCAENPLRKRIGELERELTEWKGWAADRLLAEMGGREAEQAQSPQTARHGDGIDADTPAPANTDYLRDVVFSD
jgi:hypothetical protein